MKEAISELAAEWRQMAESKRESALGVTDDDEAASARMMDAFRLRQCANELEALLAK